MIGKIMYSRDFFKHCVATDQGVFNNQNLLNNLIKRNQTWLDAIEDDCDQYYDMYHQNRLQPGWEDNFKQHYKIYLETYKIIVEFYVKVFFSGYFEIASGGHDDHIYALETLWELYANRTKEVMSWNFNNKGVYVCPHACIDIVLETRKDTGKYIL